MNRVYIMSTQTKYEQREGQGTLFVNDKKGNEKAPDYSGTVLINGKEMRIAGWKKQAKSGSTFLSIQVSEQMAPSGKTAPTSKSAAPVSDDLPF